MDCLALLQVGQDQCLEVSRRARTVLTGQPDNGLTVREAMDLDRNLLLINRGLAYVHTVAQIRKQRRKTLDYPDTYYLENIEGAVRELCQPHLASPSQASSIDERVTRSLTRINQQLAHFGVSQVAPMLVELAKRRHAAEIDRQLRKLSTDLDARQRAIQRWQAEIREEEAPTAPREGEPANFQEWLAEQRKQERERANRRRDREALVAELRRQNAPAPPSSPRGYGGDSIADATRHDRPNVLTMRGWHRSYAAEALGVKQVLATYLNPPDDPLALQQVCFRLSEQARRLLQHEKALVSPDAAVARELRAAMRALTQVGATCAEGDKAGADAHMKTVNAHLSRAGRLLAPYGLEP